MIFKEKLYQQQFYQTALGNCYTYMSNAAFWNNFVVQFSLIFGTLSFPVQFLDTIGFGDVVAIQHMKYLSGAPHNEWHLL